MDNKLYLVPAPLGDYEPQMVIPAPVLEKLREIRIFVVEELRTARRYLSQAGLKGHIAELEFHELNEHSDQASVEALAELFERGDVAMISEAGLPAVADPGAKLVALCHRHGIRVVPLVGPSSMMLALMGSGLNGQNFEFCGYLPAKTGERRSRLKDIEKIVDELKDVDRAVFHELVVNAMEKNPSHTSIYCAEQLWDIAPLTSLALLDWLNDFNEFYA